MIFYNFGYIIFEVDTVDEQKQT